MFADLFRNRVRFAGQRCLAYLKIARLHDSTVGGRVSIGPNGQGGFQLAVQLEVVIPDLPRDQAQALADAAHQVCPYSNATRGNIDVTITVSDD